MKDRIIEHLAVRKLRQERGLEEHQRAGAILALVGPPGVGKTSLGESVARALGRKFVRVARRRPRRGRDPRPPPHLRRRPAGRIARAIARPGR